MLKESEKKNLERVLNKPIMLGKGIILFFTYFYLVIAEQLDIEDEEVCEVEKVEEDKKEVVSVSSDQKEEAQIKV